MAVISFMIPTPGPFEPVVHSSNLSVVVHSIRFFCFVYLIKSFEKTLSNYEFSTIEKAPCGDRYNDLHFSVEKKSFE